MAKQQQVSTVYTDDLSGDTLTEDQVHTVTFGVDGVSYQIDLSEQNATSLRDDLASWVQHARKTSTTRRSTSSSSARGKASTNREQSAAIREWARSNGHEVSDRGRISATVIDAFNSTH